MTSSKIVNLCPCLCAPPHRVARPEQVDDLAEQFLTNGWDFSKSPALIGYEWKGRIQLLSGSHRWAAAVKAGLKTIPVIIRPFETIQEAWGDTDRWKMVMEP